MADTASHQNVSQAIPSLFSSQLSSPQSRVVSGIMPRLNFSSNILSSDIGQSNSSNVSHLPKSNVILSYVDLIAFLIDLNALHNSFLGVKPKSILQNPRHYRLDSEPISGLELKS